MKLGTDLHVARARKTVRSRQIEQRQGDSQSWVNRVSTDEKQLAVQLGIRAAQQASGERAARIEELRKQIAAGTYQVDSSALAEKLLASQSQFFRIDQE